MATVAENEKQIKQMKMMMGVLKEKILKLEGQMSGLIALENPDKPKKSKAKPKPKTKTE